MSVSEVALDPSTVIVAVDPGKAFNRVWISNGSGLLADPMSLSVSRDGISQLELALNKHGPDAPVIAVEATGSLHRPWVAELERRHPGPVRLFASSHRRSLLAHNWVQACLLLPHCGSISHPSASPVDHSPPCATEMCWHTLGTTGVSPLWVIRR